MGTPELLHTVCERVCCAAAGYCGGSGSAPVDASLLLAVARSSKAGFAAALRVVKKRLLPAGLPWKAMERVRQPPSVSGWTCEHAAAFRLLLDHLEGGRYAAAFDHYMATLQNAANDCLSDCETCEFRCERCEEDLCTLPWDRLCSDGRTEHLCIEQCAGSFLRAAGLWQLLLHGVLVPSLFRRVRGLRTLIHDPSVDRVHDWVFFPHMAAAVLGLPERMGRPAPPSDTIGDAFKFFHAEITEERMWQAPGGQAPRGLADVAQCSIDTSCGWDVCGYYASNHVAIYRELRGCEGARAALVEVARDYWAANVDRECPLCEEDEEHDECVLPEHAVHCDRVLAELVAAMKAAEDEGHDGCVVPERVAHCERVMAELVAYLEAAA